MQSFDFKAILEQVDITEAEADALYAKCKDGTLITEGATTYMDFDREADTLEEAIRSAIGDINGAGFRVTRIEMQADDFAPQYN